MAARTKPDGWYHPSTPLDAEMAGAFIDVSGFTINKVVRRLAKGDPPPKVHNPLTIKLAELFAPTGVGSTVPAMKVYAVLGIDPNMLNGPFIVVEPPKRDRKPKRVRHKAASSEQLAAMSVEELREKLNEVVARANAGGREPLAEVTAIYKALHAHGVPLSGRVFQRNVADLIKFDTWGSFGEFAARALPDDLWPFVFPGIDNRPVDLLSASEDEIRYGRLAVLSLEEWVGLIQHSITRELAEIEALCEKEKIDFAMIVESSPLQIADNISNLKRDIR